MTFMEKLKQEHPSKFHDDGRPMGCPDSYEYELPRFDCGNDCEDCWNRQVPNRDNVNHPSHYADSCSMECIDVMEMVFGKSSLATYCIVNAFKYAWRCKHKNGLEDLEKARWYLKKYDELNTYNDYVGVFAKLKDIVEKLGASYGD